MACQSSLRRTTLLSSISSLWASRLLSMVVRGSSNIYRPRFVLLWSLLPSGARRRGPLLFKRNKPHTNILGDFKDDFLPGV